jgi:hypothetical protein
VHMILQSCMISMEPCLHLMRMMKLSGDNLCRSTLAHAHATFAVQITAREIQKEV